MTMQRDPQLIARIIEMRDAGMTRAQARYTLDMGVCQFRSIITEHGISGWAWTTPEVAAAHAERIRGMTVESVERGRWVRRNVVQNDARRTRDIPRPANAQAGQYQTVGCSGIRSGP